MMAHEHEEEERAVNCALHDNIYYFAKYKQFYQNGKRMIHMTFEFKDLQQIGLEEDKCRGVAEGWTSFLALGIVELATFVVGSMEKTLARS